MCIVLVSLEDGIVGSIRMHTLQRNGISLKHNVGLSSVPSVFLFVTLFFSTPDLLLIYVLVSYFLNIPPTVSVFRTCVCSILHRDILISNSKYIFICCWIQLLNDVQ